MVHYRGREYNQEGAQKTAAVLVHNNRSATMLKEGCCIQCCGPPRLQRVTCSVCLPLSEPVSSPCRRKTVSILQHSHGHKIMAEVLQNLLEIHIPGTTATMYTYTHSLPYPFFTSLSAANFSPSVKCSSSSVILS